jgi:hypothetical protein
LLDFFSKTDELPLQSCGVLNILIWFIKQAKSVEAKLSEKDHEIEAMKNKMAEMENMMHKIGEKLEIKVTKARQNT